ncbi:hypothetical protein FLL65_11830 [Vibrio cholerae]|uniref:hypothetical protein n=1 Tax=Vibrio cholerae TaxID=666 RepID=UPI0011575C6C|nr:hypothetical protein [Vibrio cholerae]TQQ47538.1 hypothetical protein FLL65_11830 [Vibrio cholerae]
MKIFNILILTFMWSINLSWATNPNDAGAPEKQPIKPTPVEGGINNPLPNVLYRVDSRPPYFREGLYMGDGIFQVGFRTLGTNTDFLDHISGRSMYYGSRNSNFVPLSANRAFPHQWGKEMTVMPRSTDIPTYIEDHFYLYAIRPTGNVYNMYDSYRANINLLSEIHPESQASQLARLETYRHQEEWISYGPITVDQIMWADEYRLIRGGELNGQTELVRRIENPNYIPAQTEPSRTPLLLQRQEESWTFIDQVRAVFATRDGETYPLAFLSCLAFLHTHRHRDPRSIDDTFNICPELNYAYVPKSIQWVVNPQNTHIDRSMPVPWTLISKAKNYYNRESYPDNCTVEMQDNYLHIRCNANPPYPTSYRLHLGAGGPQFVWIDQTCVFSFSDEEDDGQRIIDIRDLHVINSKYNLEDYGYTIKQAFSGTGGWWSNLTITPIYPVLLDEPKSNCTWYWADNWMRNH